MSTIVVATMTGTSIERATNFEGEASHRCSDTDVARLVPVTISQSLTVPLYDANARTNQLVCQSRKILDGGISWLKGGPAKQKFHRIQAFPPAALTSSPR